MTRLLVSAAVILALACPVYAPPPPGGIGGRALIGRSNLGPAPTTVTPDQIANLFAWYKADNLVTNLAGNTPPSNGDSVKGWGDSSGNNHTLTTNNPTAAGPTWNSAATISKPQGGIQFGAGKHIRCAFSGVANTTIFVVWRNVTVGATHMPVDSTNSGNRNAVYVNGSDNFTIYSGGAFLTGGAVGNPLWNIQCGVFNGSGNDSIYTNNVLAVTGVSGNDLLDGLTVGADNAGANNLGANEWAVEILIFSRNLNSTEISQMFAYLNSRWNIY